MENQYSDVVNDIGCSSQGNTHSTPILGASNTGMLDNNNYSEMAYGMANFINGSITNGGFYQQMLISAASGALYSGLNQEGVNVCESHERVNVCEDNDDDGYLGGQEGDDGYLSGQEGDEGSCGFDVESDSDELVDTIDGGGGGTNNVHLVEDSDTEDVSGESDSDESQDDGEIPVDLRQEVYVDKAQEGVPYKKRKRAPKHQNRPNCRPPREIGAVERALRTASKRKAEYIFEPKIGMVFDSRLEAKEFYNMYAWERGFGIKYNRSRPGCRPKVKNAQFSEADNGEEEPYKSMQEIVCQRNGFDDRTTHSTKRCGCPAMIRLLRTDDYGWYISKHESTHNHELSKTDAEKREWSSHREIEPHVMEKIRELRKNNINLTKVYNILGEMFGKDGDVQWTRKSVRTVCNQISREHMDGDINKTMEIFRDMHEKDPGFRFVVELDKSSRVRTLLWCSGRGREQYECFGDVVTFDTTYCTNIYKMPFGLFVGVNNHFQTTIFAGVLMRRETTKSFKWVFKEFLKLMGGKHPQTILTDQSKVMTKAIKIMMPDTYHLWCKWHVMKKIRECLGPLYTKNKKFRNEFWLVVNGMLSVEEFETAWSDLFKKYKLEENAFMNRIYKSKEKWAKPWSKDKFCARMSSTQRSESANFLLKRFVPRNSTMNQFVTQYSKLLYERDREEDIAEHKTKQLKSKHGRLWSVERHALELYTKAAFELFRAEVDKTSNFKVGKPVGNVYTVTHDRAERRAHWQRVHFRVEVMDGGQRYVCECGLYEHFGMLCCHSLRVMIHDDIDQIPEAHIMKRWTRTARDVIPEQQQTYKKDQEALHSTIFRHRLMRHQSEDLINIGDMDIDMFEVVMKHMKNAKKEAAEKLAARKENAEILHDDDSSDKEVDCEPQVAEAEGTGVQSDGEALRRKKCDTNASAEVQMRNKYGCSGSSAHFSDTDIANLKAPLLKKTAGRPRGRYVAGSESSKKKWKKNNKKKGRSDMLADQTEVGDEQNGNNEGDGGANGNKTSKKNKKKAKRVIKCGRCAMEGHNSVQCCTMEITEDTAGTYL